MGAARLNRLRPVDSELRAESSGVTGPINKRTSGLMPTVNSYSSPQGFPNAYLSVRYSRGTLLVTSLQPNFLTNLWRDNGM